MNKVFWDSALYIGMMAIIGWMVYIDLQENKANAAALSSRKDAVCPALLSIARSARDTLIVMKSESVCNEFVLEHLK
jgi:hypothetical protein